jgi:hypothetical protein
VFPYASSYSTSQPPKDNRFDEKIFCSPKLGEPKKTRGANSTRGANKKKEITDWHLLAGGHRRNNSLAATYENEKIPKMNQQKLKNQK